MRVFTRSSWTHNAEAKHSLLSAAAAKVGFDYQLDLSIVVALQLLLISKAATRLELEPTNEEYLEADLEPYFPGRIQPSPTVAWTAVQPAGMFFPRRLNRTF